MQFILLRDKLNYYRHTLNNIVIVIFQTDLFNVITIILLICLPISMYLYYIPIIAIYDVGIY